MKFIRFCILAGALAATTAWAADQMLASRVQVDGPMGVDTGHLVLTNNQLVFVDDTNPDGTFAVPRTDISNLNLDENSGMLTIALSRPVTNDLGQQSNVVLRVSGSQGPDQIASWVGLPVNTTGEASRMMTTTTGPAPIPSQMSFAARCHGDDGRLVVNRYGITWEDLSDRDDSRSWTYPQIRELKRENGNTAVEIKTYDGNSYRFHVQGPFMTDTVYNAVANRIANAQVPYFSQLNPDQR